ncbi:MAG: amidohydrolase [Actinomycetota bacterium]
MARILITARAVYAGDPPRPGPTAVLVEDDRIAWVGDDPEARPPGRLYRRVDLGQAVVVPGFVDAHFHLATVVAMSPAVDLRDVRSARAVVGRMARAAARAPEGSWVVGWGFRELLGGTGRWLTRQDLDAAVPDRPSLVIHGSFHSGVANSAALAAVGFGRATPRWPGGELERDARGRPNGRLWERAFGVVEHAAHRSTLEALGTGWAERAGAVAGDLLSQGITHIADALLTPPEIERASDADLPLGVTAMPVSERGWYASPGAVLEGPRTDEGDERFRIGHLKLVADGGERCAMRVPYRAAVRAAGVAGAGGTTPLQAWRMLRPRLGPASVRTGTLHYGPGELAETVRRARRAGFAVAVHALGNEAIEQALSALERGGPEGARIEHAMFATPGHAEHMARLGVTAVIQPGHLWSYGSLVADAGIARFLPPVPARTLIDAGVQVALSSDAPTAVWEPLRILRVAVERRTEEGKPLAPGQAITRGEALRAATVAGAEAAGVGGRKGVISPGRQADLAVLSADPFDPRTTVLQTWVAGKRVWGAAGAT